MSVATCWSDSDVERPAFSIMIADGGTPCSMA